MEHLREYIADLEDGNRWDILFKDTQLALSIIAEGVRKEIAEGKLKILTTESYEIKNSTFVLKAYEKLSKDLKEQTRKAYEFSPICA